MTIIQALLLGLLQGAAEFLPISSSGHLIIAQRLFALDDVPLLFDIVLHVATLAAVLLFFRARVGELLKAFGRWVSNCPLAEGITGGGVLTRTDKEARQTVQAIIFATIATGGIGVITEKAVHDMSPFAVCAMFLITAAVLAISGVIVKHSSNAGKSAPALWPAIIIGVAQGVGTLPGISRSGMTISAALLCGLGSEAAGEFSFIVSIPAILGAFVLQLKDAGALASLGALPIAAGAITAFVAGYLSLAFLMMVIKRGKLSWFAVYLSLAGIAGMIYFRG